MNLISRDRVIAGVEKLRFFPLTVSGGEGAWLIETGGRRLLDLSSTWTACGLGNGHPAVAAALARVAASPSGGGALSASPRVRLVMNSEASSGCPSYFAPGITRAIVFGSE